MGYREYAGLSGTELGILAECPAKLKHQRDNGRETTQAMSFGSLVHTLILEPHEVNNRYVVMPEGMSRRGKEYEALVARSAGKELIKYDEYAEANGMAETCYQNPLAKRILQECQGENEKEIYWIEDGVACKGKIDRYLTGLNAIIDYKTAADANPRTFGYKVLERGYLLQLAHYMSGIKHISGSDKYPSAFIIAQEKDAPYVTTVYELSATQLGGAIEQRKELLAKHAECMNSGIWSGYSNEIIVLDLKERL
jgi:exodeoxyribonuclease VIII